MGIPFPLSPFALSTQISTYPVTFRELENLDLTSQKRSRHGLIVKHPETFESGLGRKGVEMTMMIYCPVSDHQKWFSEGRPGRDTRVAEDVDPVLFPFPKTATFANSRFSEGIQARHSLFKQRPQQTTQLCIQGDDISVPPLTTR